MYKWNYSCSLTHFPLPLPPPSPSPFPHFLLFYTLVNVVNVGVRGALFPIHALYYSPLPLPHLLSFIHSLVTKCRCTTLVPLMPPPLSARQARNSTPPEAEVTHSTSRLAWVRVVCEWVCGFLYARAHRPSPTSFAFLDSCNKKKDSVWLYCTSTM